jgi:hypothetical protein
VEAMVLLHDDDWDGGARSERTFREHRSKRIQEAAERLRQLKEWVCFEDLVDWCARENNGISEVERRKRQAFESLALAIRGGEFGFGRRSRVLILHPHSNWAKMTIERLRLIPTSQDMRARTDLNPKSTPFDKNAQDRLETPFIRENQTRDMWLKHCWARSDDVERWIAQRGMRLPNHLLPKIENPEAGVGFVDKHPHPATKVDKPLTAGQVNLANTSGAATKMTEWLTKRMQDNRTEPIAKAAAHHEAEGAGLRRIADRAFDRAWIDAVRGAEAPAWSNAGRRKSPQEIVAANRRGK